MQPALSLRVQGWTGFVVAGALALGSVLTAAQPPVSAQEGGLRIVELEIVGDDRGQLGQQQPAKACMQGRRSARTGGMMGTGS